MGNALLLVFSAAMSLAAAELLARWILPDRYFVWPPGLRRTFDPLPGISPGIAGPSEVTINALGIRGDLFSPDQRYRLLAVGGSTTICLHLDDSEAWPRLVQDGLDAALGPRAAWVGNVGRMGHTSVQNAIQIEKLLPQFPEIDGVLMLVGANDLLIHLALGLAPGRAARLLAMDDPTALLESAFSVFPPPVKGSHWYSRTALARLWSSRRLRSAPPNETVAEVDPNGLRIREWRNARKHASALRETLPDLSAALAQYAATLQHILDVAAAEGARVIFLTQPTLWRADLSDAERDLLWTGGPPLDMVGPGAAYYSVGALAEGMRLYNETLLRVCRERGAECIDLAGELPQSTDVFFDDMHFTEAGSRRVAEIVADYLLAHPAEMKRRRDRAEVENPRARR